MWILLRLRGSARYFGAFTAMLCLLFTSSAAQAEWAEQSCSFPHRIPVTITAGVSGHNAETRIDLTNSDFPASYSFSADGHDVRVFQNDDLTPVDFVVAGWNSAARSATIYVRLPSLPSGASETIYIYLGDNSLPSGENALVVFPDIGVRLHSRVSTADPVSTADALSAFAASTTDVDNSVRTSVSGLNNRAIGGTNGDYGWCISAVLNVTPATAGNWGFRYGADFGRGGHLYVRGQALEEDWNSDLWWANNYANTSQTLEGSITLPEGWHRYEALGFEGCCDGQVGFQARPPGGAWQDLSSTNFDLRASQCVATTVSVTAAAPESCSSELTAFKDAEIHASSPVDYLIPGAIVQYDISIENPGQMVDDGTLVLMDVFPSEIALITSGADAFAFSNGAVTSGLGFTYGGPSDMSDSVEFSTDGADFTYQPSAPKDGTVTHIRFTPTGSMNPNDSGAIPSFSIRILGEVK